MKAWSKLRAVCHWFDLICPHICIFAWLTTDLRVFSVICQIVSSNRVCGCDYSLTKQPILVSNVLKIQIHTLSVHTCLKPGLYKGLFCTSPSSTLCCSASYNTIISLFLKKFRKKREVWVISWQNKGLRMLGLCYKEPYPPTHTLLALIFRIMLEFPQLYPNL